MHLFSRQVFIESLLSARLSGIDMGHRHYESRGEQHRQMRLSRGGTDNKRVRKQADKDDPVIFWEATG